MRIRAATLQDSQKLARVHVESWKTTYSEIISNDYLSNLSIKGIERSWKWTFTHPHQDEITYVLVNEKDEIAGFLNGGRCRDCNRETHAELYSIYLLKEHQNQGLGKQLFHKFIEYLKSLNYQTLKVWVLQANPSIYFYTHLGGEVNGNKMINIGDESFLEMSLQWKDVREVDNL